ncbi:hypothetical protein DPMN_018322 [Dreissena polymorpha]|uniref:Uncharacterized protein n=1 Tax=Dreissena polymorpha TaxID=45954 RepID=A0A9D4RZ27_DREPO|nr:hypothetical protein DPMN_044676 [Dreissena polymorpha]KAH3777993.1 hypothetical protein DPMN_179445 [Dreissena polymorpha]KAH3883877.1 hypothetical protein DPMN_007845 [Dreissena polymorpha]KAH3894164.1 hypothetical protein DPMN_018322 [Dreissena polymorpha]
MSVSPSVSQNKKTTLCPSVSTGAVGDVVAGPAGTLAWSVGWSLRGVVSAPRSRNPPPKFSQ